MLFPFLKVSFPSLHYSFPFRFLHPSNSLLIGCETPLSSQSHLQHTFYHLDRRSTTTKLCIPTPRLHIDMAPVIFGLPFDEFKWSKFGNANMWNRVYHLRRTKFIVYQLAMIFCVVSESLGTDALSRYVSQQKYVHSHGAPGKEYNNDYVGVASYNIFAGIYVATIFGGAFFFDLIWPERREDHGVRVAWKWSAISTIFVHLASCIAMTVIVAQRTAYITGVSAQEAARLVTENGKIVLTYKHSARIVTSVVFAWVGWVFVIVR